MGWVIAASARNSARPTLRSSRPASWAAPKHALLRRLLVATDVVALCATWALVLGPLDAHTGTAASRLACAAAITVAGIALMASQQLYLARVCRLRTVETSRLVRVSVVISILVKVVGPRWGVDPSVTVAAVAALFMAASLSTMRGIYTLWLRHRRSAGLHRRPVVVVGAGEEGDSLLRLIQGHPELGFEAEATLSPGADLMQALEDHCSDTVVIATGAFSGAELNRTARFLLDNGVHVHLSTGLIGIDQRRLRAQPIAREPMFYLEPLRIPRWHKALKRLVDIVGSAIGLLVAMPVLVVAAVAIKIEDRGPVMFRHQRVGRNGTEFTIFKLRTMVPNAHRQLHLVAAKNQRAGPLFKSHDDPRVTRVGRMLRASSIDELPQLLNVLLGTMSLVGPRPALAHEVAEFDAELRNRERVRPGITGLWQIEGRDDPSFDAYRRLDLFYIENWTLELDLVILLATARAVVVQGLRDLRRQWKSTVGLRELHVIELTDAIPVASPRS